MKFNELKKRSAMSTTRWGSVLLSAVTHLIVGTVGFQIGFALGDRGIGGGPVPCSSSLTAAVPPPKMDKASGTRFASEQLVCPDSPLVPQEAQREESAAKKTNADEHCSDNKNRPLFPKSMESLFAGAARVNRTQFALAVDIGVPVATPEDKIARGNEEVLILYNSKTSLPKQSTTKGRRKLQQPQHVTTSSDSKSGIAHFDNVDDAIQNCKAMRVVILKPRLPSDCLAIMGQWESYHVHLLRRLGSPSKNNESDTSVSSTHKNAARPPSKKSENKENHPEVLVPSLRYVSRSMNEKGIEAGGTTTPSGKATNDYWEVLMDYLSKKNATLERLKPLAQAAAAGTTGDSNNSNGNKAVVVMLVNWGQSGVFLNFVCAARSRGLDLSNVLMFATDSAAFELARSLNIHVFDVGDAFGAMPEEAAKVYGDRAFNRMMLAKVYCVQLVLELGYDVLFQDVDVIWKRNPLDFFRSSSSSSMVREYDLLFQDDGARTVRHVPFCGNSGFYFVKYNARTLYFFNVFLRMGDLVLANRSHQAAMMMILNEHISWRGLRVKVFGRDSKEGEFFPGGYHFHRKKEFMKRYIASSSGNSSSSSSTSPYIFHMCWTESKENKRLFFQQLGEWFVQPQCEGKKVDEIVLLPNKKESDRTVDDVTSTCCAVKPLIQCHYRDKPSIINCQDSQPLDKGKPSFWL